MLKPNSRMSGALVVALCIGSQFRSTAVDPSQSRTSPQALALGAVVERDVAPGDVQTHDIAIGANEYARVVVRSTGVPSVARLMSPAGTAVIERTSWMGDVTRRSLSVVSTAAGVYRLEVRLREGVEVSGRATVTLVERRVAQSGDL